jgi:hypothetical protein
VLDLYATGCPSSLWPCPRREGAGDRPGRHAAGV